MSELAATPASLLTLKEAAERLSVHPATLRRWADRGDVLVVVTPGGHRRFPRSEVERLARGQRGAAAPPATAWKEQALSHTRAEIAEHRHEGWLSNLDEAARDEQRALGRRLMSLMTQFVGDAAARQDLLDEAQAIGRAYAQITQRTGLGLSQTLQAMMFFRESIVESVVLLPGSGPRRPEADKRLLRRINTFLNAILLGVAETYES